MTDLACPRCFGRGQVSDPTREPRDAAYQVRCPACRGRKVVEVPERQPILCFEEDLDAGLAAAKLLATQGFAQMPDGYWMVSQAHAGKIMAQIAHILKESLTKDLDGGRLAVIRLGQMLPGGDQ